MGGDAEFRHTVHLNGADLHLNRAVTSDHCGVQRLVAVGLGQTDVVLETTGNWTEGVMHHGQGPVTGLDTRRDDPQRGHVVDLVERLLLALHLAPDAEQVLRTAADFTTLKASLSQAVVEQCDGDPQPLLPLTALAGHLLLDLPERLRLQQLERQVLQFPLEATDAQPIGQGGIDLAGLPGNALALLVFERPKGPHVVKPIRQLHQHHADVTGHRQEHSPQVLGLGLGAVVEVNATQLGDSLHQLAHFRPEMQFDLVRGDVGVFHHVMQEPGGDHAGAGADVPQQIGNGNGMNDVRVTAGPELALMQLKTEIEGRHQQRFRIRRTALPQARWNVEDALPEPLRQRNVVFVRVADRMTPQLRTTAHTRSQSTVGPGGVLW